MNLLADRHRALVVAGALTALLAAAARYTFIAMTIETGFRQSLAAGAAADGRTLTFPLWVVTRVVDDDHYEISKVIRDVPIQGSTRELAEGATVSVMGTFRARDGTVVETVREVHVLRKWKEALGVLGTVVALAGAPFLFRIRGGRLVERG